jgi:hypothetical protein
MKHAEGKIEGEIFQIILAGTFDADKTGWIHGVGRLALDWAGTNERVGVCGKKFTTDRSTSAEILLPWLKLRPNDIRAGKARDRVG